MGIFLALGVVVRALRKNKDNCEFYGVGGLNHTVILSHLLEIYLLEIKSSEFGAAVAIFPMYIEARFALKSISSHTEERSGASCGTQEFKSVAGPGTKVQTGVNVQLCGVFSAPGNGKHVPGA